MAGSARVTGRGPRKRFEGRGPGRAPTSRGKPRGSAFPINRWFDDRKRGDDSRRNDQGGDG